MFDLRALKEETEWSMALTHQMNPLAQACVDTFLSDQLNHGPEE